MRGLYGVRRQGLGTSALSGCECSAWMGVGGWVMAARKADQEECWVGMGVLGWGVCEAASK